MSQQKKTDVDLGDWRSIETRLLPIIQTQARRHERFLPYGTTTFDDLVQEGRIELFNKLDKYNHKRGVLEAFANRVLSNFYYVHVRKLLRQKSMPRAEVLVNNNWKKSPVMPTSYHSLASIESIERVPFQVLAEKDAENLVNEFIDELRANLTGFHADVLSQILAREKVAVERISSDLGIKKNQVNWSSKRIKSAFSKLALKDRYSELFGNMVKSTDWPIFHKSPKNKFDKEFIKETLEKRCLSKRCLKVTKEITKDKKCQRLTKDYKWGKILMLRYKGQVKTLIIEGNFNPRTGYATGKRGARLLVPVLFYKNLNEVLANG